MREDTKVRGAEDNNNDARGSNKGDSNVKEVENNAEALAEVGDGFREESAAAFSEPKHRTVATLSYCATFSNIKKTPIHLASDACPNYKVNNLTANSLQLWVNKVIKT